MALASRLLAALLAAPLVAPLSVGALGVPSYAAVRPRIVVLGDSLTSGRGIGKDRAFPAVLQDRLDDSGYRFEVMNAGVSGDTSLRARRRLTAALEGDVRVLVVALGANDGLRGVPVTELKQNLTAILEEARARGLDVLLCGMEALPIHGWSYTVTFHQTYEELASVYDVPLVPFMMMGVLGNRDLMQSDRVHPNAKGARAMADHVWPYLERLLQRSGYSPASM